VPTRIVHETAAAAADGRPAVRRRAAILALLAAGWLLAAAPSPGPPTTPPPAVEVAPGVRATGGAAPGYVDDAVCATCHAELAESFREVGMGRSFYRPAPERDVETLSGPGSRYEHPRSGRVYEMERRGEALVFRRWQRGPDGEPINRFETEVEWILGSGNHSRTYLYRNPAGELYQLPIAWYSQEGGWAMAPGFDQADHPGLMRPILRECMFCHNAYPEAPAGSDAAAAPDVYPERLPEGIGCQRCHGPGAEHVRLAAGGLGSPRAIRASMVNPAKLEPVLRDDVCWQCHMQPTAVIPGARRVGRGTWSYRPGEPLSDYLLHVDIDETERAQGDRFEINHHPYRLRQSRCWTESARRLSCLTCHDPHRKVPESERAVHYRAACLGCHETAECGVEHAAGLPAELAAVDRLDCVACHMPKRRTQDVVHVVMTDHLIRRRPSGDDLVAPLEERDPVVEGIEILDPERAPGGPLRDFYLALAVVQVAGAASEEALDRLAADLQMHAELPEIEAGGDDARLTLAMGQLKARDWDGAASTLERALDGSRPDPLTLELLGLARSGQGRRAHALALLERVARPGARPQAYYNLGRLLLAEGRNAEAEAALTRAVELRPTSAAAWHQLGRALERRGDVEGGTEAQRRALAAEPRLTAAYVDLARLLAAAGEREEALRWLRHGRRAAAEPGELADALAELEGERAPRGGGGG